jgi:hypothetical protein
LEKELNTIANALQSSEQRWWPTAGKFTRNQR